MINFTKSPDYFDSESIASLVCVSKEHLQFIPGQWQLIKKPSKSDENILATDKLKYYYSANQLK